MTTHQKNICINKIENKITLKLGDLDWNHTKILAHSSRPAKDKQGFELASMRFFSGGRNLLFVVG